MTRVVVSIAEVQGSTHLKTPTPRKPNAGRGS